MRRPSDPPALAFLTRLESETLTWKFRNLHPDKFPLIELRPQGLLAMAAEDTLIAGQPGTGKTWLLNELLIGALSRGNRVILVQCGQTKSFSSLDFWTELGADLIRIDDSSPQRLSDSRLTVLDAGRSAQPSFGTLALPVMENIAETLLTIPESGEPTVIAFEGVDAVLHSPTITQAYLPSLAVKLKQTYCARLLFTLTHLSDCVTTSGGKRLYRFCPSLILGSGPEAFGRDRPIPAGFSIKELELLEVLDKKAPDEHDFFVRTCEGCGLGRLTPSSAEKRLFEGVRFHSLRAELTDTDEPGLPETRYRLPRSVVPDSKKADAG